MKISDTTRWITRTAVFVALLIVLQAITAPLGNTIVTGSLVNFMLIASVMLSGVSSGVAVALISPVMAKLINIGPLWSLIPFIILGNISIVLVWHLVGNKLSLGKTVSRIMAMAAGALTKFAVLYLGVVKLAVPIILRLPEAQAAVISAMFPLPQLLTATIGGLLAIILLPPLEKISERRNNQD